jgi:D-alanyl-D-alanine carboxypeptidase
MKKISFFLGIVLLTPILFLHSTCEDEINLQDELCEGNQCFSIQQFGDNLATELDKAALGWSYAIYFDESLQKWDANGQARRPQDGNVYNIDAFSTDMNVGSCAKSITAIATLQVLEANNLTVMEPIVNHLPSWWTIGSNLGQVTFRDLLRHESGFRPDQDAVNYSQIRAEIADGISNADYGVYQYQNMNFCILRILIPILNGDFNRDFTQSDLISQQLTTSAFMDYLRTQIFDPLNVDVSCDNADQVLYYSYANPSLAGENPGDECNNAGGGTLSMSANDLCKTMHFAFFTNDLLSTNMQALMFDGSDPGNLGLGCYSNEVNTSQSWGWLFHHNGGFTINGRGANACWYTFHNGVTVAVSTNSDGSGITSNGYMDINDLIEQAYDNAW